MVSENHDYMINFQNILSPGKEPCMTKRYNPKAPLLLDKYLTPEQLKQYVFKSENVKKLCAHYSEKTGKSVSEISKVVLDILFEIGLDRNYWIIRSCGICITAVGKRICSGIYVNEFNLNKIKSGLGKNPVLYLPSHRSYCDFILMSYICFHYDIEIPGIAAGMDFHGMVGMGTMLRKTGAFFMRRSFTGDELYWDIFRQYMNALMSVYHIGVEFFVEGTRSRNFKALLPKVGLLSMALQPYFMGELSDVTIVPISISYERLLEEQLFVYELLGVPKPKESTKGFFKALKIVAERFGSMYVDFGEPISVRKYFGENFDRTKYSNIAGNVQKLDKTDIELLKTLANETVYQQQRRIVITTFNLICLYYNYRSFKNLETNLENLSNGILLLKDFLKSNGALCATNNFNVKDNIIKTIEIHSNIMNLPKGHLFLNYKSQDKIDFNKIDKRKLKGYPINPQMMKLSIPVLSVQLYINACMFWLANPAVIVLCAMDLQNGKNGFNENELKLETKELNNVFANEFVFPSHKINENFIENLASLAKYNILEIDGNRNIKFKSTELSDILCSTIAPFLCMYLRLSETILKEFLSKQFREKEVLIANQKFIEELLMLRANFVHPYCLALDNLSIAIGSFVQNKFLIKLKKSDNAFIYECNENKFKEFHKLILKYCNLLPFNNFIDKNNFNVFTKL